MRTSRNRPYSGVLALLAFALAACAGEAQDQVRCGEWTREFETALSLSRQEGRPLVTTAYAPFCGYCKRARTAFESEAFRTWARAHQCYLVESYFALTNENPQQAAAVRFVKDSQFWGGHSYPFVNFYRPATASNGEIRVSFSARRDRAPGSGGKKLEDVLIGAFAEVQTTNFLAQLRARELAKHPPAKKIVAAAEGPGSVRMVPESGELPKDGSVVLTAEPSAGAVFVGWKSPTGKRITWTRQPELKLRFSMKAGTYTAIFRKDEK